MSYQLVPTAAKPDQTFQVYLGNQNCTIRIYQRTFGLYVDLYLDNRPVLFGVLAKNLVKIVRDKYRAFKGDLFFFDTKGETSPDYAELGSRFVLLYDAAA